jgi:large subunit ribosomal protein L29
MRELKAERIREMTEDDIRTKIRELKEELFHLRFRNTVRQLSNPLLLREKKRGVARLETILAEHRLGIRSIAAPGLASGTAGEAKAPARAEAKPAAPGTKSAAGKKKAGAKSASGRGSKPAAQGKGGRAKSSSGQGKSKGKKRA